MNDNLMTPEQLATRWSVPTKTLGQWRWSGRGPKFLKLGKRIMYRMEDIHEFEKETRFQNTSQYGNGGQRCAPH